MADLQSCYFCGEPATASLDTYPVVPASLRTAGGDQPTVVLCPTCREKLSNVLEPVVSAASAGGVRASPDGTDASPSRSASDETESAAESEMGERTASLDVETPGEDADAGPAATSTAEPSTAEQTEQSGRAEQSGQTGQTGQTESGADQQAKAGDSETESDDQASGEQTAPNTESSPEGDTPTGPSASPPGDDELVGHNTDAYRQVLRLLRNREFPVDRAEIEDIAASAYELSPAECEGAINTIVQKGLLIEENGKLIKP